MIISSLFGLLITRYVGNMIQYTSAFHNYYQAYYLANAPLQLQLVKQQNRDFGFEDEILSWSNTVKNNLNCEKCFFHWNLQSRSDVLVDKTQIDHYPTDCSWDDSNFYSLSYWQAIIIPLFWDQNSWEWEVDWNNIQRLSSINDIDVETSTVDDYIIWIVDTDLNIDRVDDVWQVSLLNYDSSKNTYFIIANITWLSTQNFCLSSNEPIPTSYININTTWKYHNTYVWLSFTKNVKLPEYLIYSIIES